MKSSRFSRLIPSRPTAAVGVDGLTQQTLPDIVSASALAGLRYSF